MHTALCTFHHCLFESFSTGFNTYFSCAYVESNKRADKTETCHEMIREAKEGDLKQPPPTPSLFNVLRVL